MVSLCFREKSTCIKCLVFLLFVFIVILVAIAVILVNRQEDTHVCKTEFCINLSARVLRYIDQSVNACDDFHAFTCGSYIKSRERPVSNPEREIEAMIKQMVQTGDSKPFIMQKSFYLACANLGAIERDDDETILNLFYSLGDWPVLRGANWDGTLFDWTEVAKISRRLGSKFDWFLDFSIYEDVNDTGLNILKIDVPPLTPLKESEIFPRQKLLTKVAVALGAPAKLAHYETGRTIDFENSLRILAEAHRKKKSHLNLVFPPKITINEIQLLWPNIQWLELINNVTGLRLTGADYVIFDEVLDYVVELNRLIYGTPKRIVADYMMWKIVEELWPYLSQLVREKFLDFNQTEENHRQPELDRQKFCINESRKQFPLIVESEYIRRHVTLEKRQLVKDMIFIVRNKFTEMLRKATWKDRELRHRALTRLSNLEFVAGGPRQVFDEFGFSEDLGLYGFVFKSTNIIDMLCERRVRFYDSYFGVVNQVVSNTTLKFYEKVVNITRFTAINDTLIIPAAALTDAFYNPRLPNYFNYATLGKALARQIFQHVFERTNITDDYDNLWTSDVFDSEEKCLIKQSSYLHNSDFKRQEKMRLFLADFIAPEIAYESYKEWALMSPREPKLPGLEFTPNQLFWIHTSKLSCNKIYSKHDRDYSRFKIIGPLRNSRNFAADYNCTEGSLMYAKKPCRMLSDVTL